MARSIKRRGFVKALAAVPAAPALLAQQQQPAPPAGQPANPAPGIPQNPTHGVQARGTGTLPKLDTVSTDVAAEPMPHFFSAPEYAALTRLCDLLEPPVNGSPGAVKAKAPEFLDFLIGRSPAERQQVYRAGLEALNTQAQTRFGKSFAAVNDSDAATLLAPLREAWTYEPPKDPLARFLLVAKHDIRTATVNSREYNASNAARGGRRFGATGLYWYALD